MEGILFSFSIWIGWACTLLLFQLIHLFFPLTVYIVSPVFAFGMVLSIIFFIKSWSSVTSTSLPLSKAAKISFAIIIFLIFLISVWIISRSMLSPTNYDSGLYHFNTIRWINSFPIVPGLGNLHGRLAFNQSFFTYVAALNLHPFFDQGRYLANSFLLHLTLLTLIEVTLPLIRQPAHATRSQLMQWAPGIFCFPIVAYWALFSNGLASPAPDMTSGLMQVVIFVVFGRTVVNYVKDGRVSLCDSIVLFILSATAITVKLSNIAFCGVIMTLVLIGLLKTSDKRIGDSLRLLLPAMLIILVWCVRGVILSGAPLYPSTIGYIHMEWSVPINKVIDEANWVYSWARQPYTHWSNVLGNWHWLTPWFYRIMAKIDIVCPVGIFILLMLLSTSFSNKKSKDNLFVFLMLSLPIFIGIIFWFMTAPEPRFANALFLLLPIPAIMLFSVDDINKLNNKISFTIFIWALLISGALLIFDNFNLLHSAVNYLKKELTISTSGYQPVKKVPLHTKYTKSGLMVYMPVKGDQCWDAPLPCTPYFNENIRLIKQNDLSSGFTVSDPEQHND